MADILIRGIGNIPVGQEFVIVENIDFERYLYNRETGSAFHLVPLPEGHGRLIDADAVVKTICNSCDGACDVVQCDCLNCKADCRCDIMKEISDAHTIVPAEGGTDDGN